MQASWLGVVLMALVVVIGFLATALAVNHREQRRAMILAFGSLACIVLLFCAVSIAASQQWLAPLFALASFVIPVGTYFIVMGRFRKPESEASSKEASTKDAESEAIDGEAAWHLDAEAKTDAARPTVSADSLTSDSSKKSSFIAKIAGSFASARGRAMNGVSKGSKPLEAIDPADFIGPVKPRVSEETIKAAEAPQPAPAPAPASAPMPAPKPNVEPALKPKAEPMSEPTPLSEQKTGPIVGLKPESVAEAKPIPEVIVESQSELLPKPAQMPAPTPEPVESVSVPVPKPEPAPVSAPVPESVPAPEPKPEPELIFELASEPEPVSEPMPEPESEPEPVPIPEPKPSAFEKFSLKAQNLKSQGSYQVAARLFAEAAKSAPNPSDARRAQFDELACYVSAQEGSKARALASQLRNSKVLTKVERIKLDAVERMA